MPRRTRTGCPAARRSGTGSAAWARESGSGGSQVAPFGWADGSGLVVPGGQDEARPGGRHAEQARPEQGPVGVGAVAGGPGVGGRTEGQVPGQGGGQGGECQDPAGPEEGRCVLGEGVHGWVLLGGACSVYVFYCTTVLGKGRGPVAPGPSYVKAVSPATAAQGTGSLRPPARPGSRPGARAGCPRSRLPGAGTPRRRPRSRVWAPERVRWGRPGMPPPAPGRSAHPGGGAGGGGCGRPGRCGRARRALRVPTAAGCR